MKRFFCLFVIIYFTAFSSTAQKYVDSGIKTIFKISGQLHFRAEAYGFVPIREIVEADNYIAVYNERKNCCRLS